MCTGEEDDLYGEAMGMEPHWAGQWDRYLAIARSAEGLAKSTDDDGFEGFTAVETEAMAKLPRRVSDVCLSLFLVSVFHWLRFGVGVPVRRQ